MHLVGVANTVCDDDLSGEGGWTFDDGPPSAGTGRDSSTTRSSLGEKTTLAAARLLVKQDRDSSTTRSTLGEKTTLAAARLGPKPALGELIGDQTSDALSVNGEYPVGHSMDDPLLDAYDAKHYKGNNEKNDLAFKGIWDSGCRRTVAGSWWIQNYVQEVEARGYTVGYEKDDAVFRFGNQGTLPALRKWKLPVQLYGTLGQMHVSEVAKWPTQAVSS